MTKSHPLHRKKSIHRLFRRSFRIKRLYWRVNNIIDQVVREKEKVAK